MAPFVRYFVNLEPEFQIWATDKFRGTDFMGLNTHTHTHMHTNRTDCPTYTTKVVGNELHDAEIEYLRMAANKAQGVGLQ